MITLAARLQLAREQGGRSGLDTLGFQLFGQFAAVHMRFVINMTSAV